MEEMNIYQETLSSVQNTISNCDNKASTLLTAVGIVFGFSLFSIQEFAMKAGCLKVLSYAFGAFYLSSFATSLILLVMIVFPRRRNKKEKQNMIEYSAYSEDLYSHLGKHDIESFVRHEITDEAIMDQIKICTRICHVKENLLRAAVISIVLFTLFLVALVTCLVI